MFGLFGNKKKKSKTVSRITLTRQAGLQHLTKELVSEKKPVFIFYFFEESKKNLQELLTAVKVSFKETNNEPFSADSDVYFINARTFNPLSFKFSSVNHVYCLDHYPLHSVFLNLSLGLGEIPSIPDLITYGSLDEPILTVFGGERMTVLMQKMGVSETELIEHNMITASIERAQKKIEEKVLSESKANSASEWFKLNYNPV